MVTKTSSSATPNDPRGSHARRSGTSQGSTPAVTNAARTTAGRTRASSELTLGSPERFIKDMEAESGTWSRVIREKGIKGE